MKNNLTLKDGRGILIRPLRHEDIDASYAFFRALPDGERIYMRGDVTDREVVEQRYRDHEQGMVIRRIALLGDEIIGDGALELADHGWEKHVGELRLVIAPAYQGMGLGLLLTRELCSIAASEKVEEIVVRMMAPQKAAIGLFKRLGFGEEIVLVAYVKDRAGNKQDLVMLRSPLNRLHAELVRALDGADRSGGRAD